MNALARKKPRNDHEKRVIGLCSEIDTLWILEYFFAGCNVTTDLQPRGMSQPGDVRVKREALDDSTLRSMTEQSSDAIWERRFHRLAAFAFSHGVAAAAIAEIDDTAEAEGEPDAGSALWLGRRVRVEGKAGLGCVRFAGKVAFADGMWLGVEMDEAEGKHDGVIGDVRYFQCPAALRRRIALR